MWWDTFLNLKEGPAMIIAALITIVGAGIGILLGSRVFGGKVKDLESALDASNAAVEDFREQMAEKLSAVDEQLSVTLEALTQLRGSVSDLRNDVEEQDASVGHEMRNAFKHHWYALRDEIWRLSQSSSIHGKTRSRYARFTNNEIGSLIEAMIADGHMSESDARPLREAHELWVWHRNGKPEMTQSDVDKMRDSALRVIPNYRGSDI